MQVRQGMEKDIDVWMELVGEIRWNFPGLETMESLCEHRETVLRFMQRGQALCVKEGDTVTGVLLFSRKRNISAASAYLLGTGGAASRPSC